MKRLAAYWLLLSTFASCTVDRNDGYDREVDLAFQPAMHVPARSDVTEEYPQGQPFAVRVWVLPENEVYLDSECLPDSHGDIWFPETGKVWPESGKSLKAIGFTPADMFETCKDGVACNGFDASENQTDLLYTSIQAGLDKNECGGVVPMPFRHALSQVDFRVKNRVAEDEAIIIRRIQIDDAAYKGDFNSTLSPQWRAEDDMKPFVFFEGEYDTGHQPEEIGRVWKMIPQTLATRVSVTYEYRTAAGTGFSTTVRTCDLQTTLEPGRHYTYTLSVGIDDVIFLQEIIEHRFR